jgi:hypothetical protein
MTSPAIRIPELNKAIHRDASVEDLLAYLNELNGLLRETSEISTISDLLISLFFYLRQHSVGNVKLGTKIILEHLLPQMVGATSQEWGEYSSMRYSFRQWLDQYPQNEMEPLREQVLDWLISRLETDRVSAQKKHQNYQALSNICSLLSYVGYRRPDIEAILENIERQDNGEAGDIALSTLTTLGITGPKQIEWLGRLRMRLIKRQSPRLLSTLHRFDSPQALDLIRDLWRDRKSIEKLAFHDIDLLLWHIASIADSHSDNARLQDKAWATVLRFGKHHPKLKTTLYIAGSLSTTIDSPKVIPYFFYLMGQRDETDQIGDGRRLAQYRIEECSRPRQLRSWSKIPRSSEVIDLLRSDATENTKLRVRMTTSEQMKKEGAWHTLLLLGDRNLLSAEWFEQAIAQEDDRYVRAHLMRYLACHRITKLPQSLIDWVTTPFDMEQDSPDHSEDDEIFSREAAAELVASAGTMEAFRVLLNFGLNLKGDALYDSIEALEEITRFMVSQGSIEVIDELYECFANAPLSRHRIAAAAALEDLAISGQLPSEHFKRLAELVEIKEDRFELSFLISTLRNDPQGLSEKLVERLATWAEEEPDKLSVIALETLAGDNHLPRYLDRLAPKVGLSSIDDEWRITENLPNYGFRENSLGWLFTYDTDTFSKAMADLLGSRSWRVVEDVMDHLVRTKRRDKEFSVPGAVINAIVDRIYKMETRSFSEPGLFRVLEILEPKKLLEEDWDKQWNNWRPGARAALARALGRLRFRNPELKGRIVYFLLSLVLDNDYGVRRAALQAISKVDPHVLFAACYAWINSQDLELKKRSAEAYGWITPSDYTRSTEIIFSLAVCDPEPEVRKIAEQTWKDTMKRKRARQYLQKIKRAQPSSDDIFRLWCYGNALTHVGDDSTVEALRKLRYRKGLPVHLAKWFAVLAEDTEKKWKKIFDKRDKAWYTWEGIIAEKPGRLRAENNSVAASLSLWMKTATETSPTSSWGGTARPIGNENESFLDFLVSSSHEPRIHVEVEGGGIARANISRTSTSGPILAFDGTGPPPSLEDDKQIHIVTIDNALT